MNVNEMIFNKSSINNDEDFNIIADWFNNEKILENRFNTYTKYKEENSLEDEAVAKLHILNNLFGNYIIQQINEAQNLCNSDEEDNIEAASHIINKIKKIKFILKEYDKVTFKEYLVNTIGDINYDEINAIFEKEVFTPKEISIIANAIKATLNKSTHDELNDYSKSFLNHELTNLFSLSRKKLTPFNEDNFDKYKILAKALIEYNKNEKIEGFDGAITYLIDLDIKHGLFNIDSSYNENLYEIMQKVQSNDFSKRDIEKLMFLAVKESKNFEDDGFGGIKDINNSGSSLRLKGVSDRCFGKILLHSVSKPEREYQQVGRAAQLKITASNKENSQDILTEDFPVSIQIGTKPAISRQLLEISNKGKIPISSREQLILSYANNFSYYLQLITDKDVSIDILKTGPVELYTTVLKQSKRFMTDFLNSEDKINSFVQSYINVLESTDILNIPNSTFSEDKKHIHILKPLKMIFDSMLELYEDNPEKYGQTFSNLCHLLNNNKDLLLSGNKENASDFKSRYRIIKGFEDELLPVKKQSTSLLKYTYLDLEDDLSLCEIIREKIDQPKDLMKYIEENLDSLTFDKLTVEEIEALKNIPEEIKRELMPLFNLLARDAFEALTNTGALGRPLELDIAIPVIDKLTSYNKEERIFEGRKESYNMESPSARKIFTMFYSDNFSDSTWQQLEVFTLLAHITDGKLIGPKNSHRKDLVLNKRLGI